MIALTGSVISPLSAAAAGSGSTPDSTPAQSTASGVGFAQPAAALGNSWSNSSDEAVVGVGDSDGYHIMVARESRAFAWTNLVTLDVPAIDLGPWTGEVCTTGDGRYAVAVYAPSLATNNQSLEQAGAYAAAIDLTTGKATPIAAGVQLAYDTPGCGTGDQVTLTRALGANEQQTQIIDVNAATSAITAITTVSAQVTNVVPTASGDVGVIAGGLVRINAKGTYTKLAGLGGEAYSVVATNQGVDAIAASNGSTSVVEHWTGSRLERLGTGPLDDLQLYPQAGGGDLLAGDVAKVGVADSGIRTLSLGSVPGSVSQHGDLLVDSAVSEQVAAMTQLPVGSSAADSAAGRIDVSTTATHSSSRVAGVVAANGPISTSTATLRAASAASATGTGSSSLSPSLVSPDTVSYGVPGGFNPPATEDYEQAVDLSTEPSTDTQEQTSCLVPRNNPSDQVLQPNPDMIEWAVDQAVHGDLNVQRPANYLQTGEAAYVPQQMFPPTSLVGGGSIPAQVELGILAQESNFKQASWHAVPGDSGNPLVSDYYGTAVTSGVADDPDIIPDYTNSDCGYGVGQVTDGMSSIKANPYSQAEATAVATDYAANIAASIQILGLTWNQLAQMSPSMLLNNGSTSYIENWYFTIWGYNSGVYAQADASQNGGYYGLGWFNNPANPNYPANRAPFLDNETSAAGGNDASNPQYWPYQEKVMGWIAHPQQSSSGSDYALANLGTSTDDTYFHNANTVNLPTFGEFCSSVNDCTTTSGCQPVGSNCWWHLPATWITTENSQWAATENLAYSLGSGEPAVVPQYESDCPNEATFDGQFSIPPYVVTDLNDPDQNTRGCAWSTNGGADADGKFTLRLGDNIAITGPNGMQDNPATAQIDLHQLGTGFLGHIYFTHTYDSASLPSDPVTPVSGYSNSTSVPTDIANKVVGTWTPNIPLTAAPTWYTVYISVPDHGGAATTTYVVDQGFNNGSTVGSVFCSLTQSSPGTSGSDYWLDVGTFDLYPGADVRMSNMVSGATGSNDVSFGAMVFEPWSSSGAPGGCSGAHANIQGY
ncbi:MAG TPA: hypothetical protein VGM10_09815 [Actinocrinis sp.]